MGSYRVYQIAKDNNLISKDIMDICAKIGINVKSHSSAVTDDELKKIIEALKNNGLKNIESDKVIKKEDSSKGQINKKNDEIRKTDKEGKSFSKTAEKHTEKIFNEDIKHINLKKEFSVSEKPEIKEPAISDSLNYDNDKSFKEEELAASKEIYGKEETKIKSRPLKWEEEKKLNVRNVLLKELDKEDKLVKSRNKSIFTDKTDDSTEADDDFNKARKKKSKKIEEEDQKKRPEIKKLMELPAGATIKQLSERINIPSNEIIKTLFKLGEIVSINQPLDNDLIEILSSEYNFKFIIIGFENKLDDLYKDEPEDLVLRPPIVTVMGHVDHGKTTLLDAIRKSDVASGETGGITQHIGAYQIEYKNRKITFIDTPGHEAFTSMRARGARVTDLAIIVVAANDGIMPQTVEAIDHAKAAGVPMIVAINKVDLPDADPEKVKKSLTEYGLVAEEWGGDTICVEVSAKNKINIDELLEMILLVADMHDIKGNPSAEGYGIIIESRLDKGMGPIGSVIVKRGSVKVGDFFITGNSFGKVRALQDDKGSRVANAVLSQPVEILGFSFVPKAGDKFFIVKNEKIAKELLSKKLYTENLDKISESKRHISLEQISEIAKLALIKKLGIVLKADVNGSLDAVEQALLKIETDEVKID
ncbi:translation initiation factor IF-2, partial [bacterium]|nr:translation initiation factor IF-2 [bacterium]